MFTIQDIKIAEDEKNFRKELRSGFQVYFGEIHRNRQCIEA